MNGDESHSIQRSPGTAPVPVDSSGAYREGAAYALWCLILVGLGGVHRIYLGKYATGILWLLTFGLFGIGQLCDLFRMRRLVRDANVRDGYLVHPRLAHLLSPASPREPEERELLRTLLRAAQQHGGSLSVTQAVAATGLPFARIERTLREMVVEGYVDVDNEPGTGVVVYRFPELSPSRSRNAGAG